MKNTKLLTEFLGTFFLVTVVSFTGNPLAIGGVLLVLVYSGGHISGAHYNPAVTLAMYLRKKISQTDALYYVAVQMLGAIAAAALYLFTHQVFFIPQPSAQTTLPIAFVLELIFTFLLVRTILSVAADSRVKGNQYFGLAIGAALFVGATAAGPLSGGAFNPAVGVGPLLLDINHLSNHLPLIVLYIAGPLAGGALAAIIE